MSMTFLGKSVVRVPTSEAKTGISIILNIQNEK